MSAAHNPDTCPDCQRVQHKLAVDRRQREARLRYPQEQGEFARSSDAFWTNVARGLIGAYIVLGGLAAWNWWPS